MNMESDPSMTRAATNDDAPRTPEGQSWCDFAAYDNSNYRPGRSRWTRYLWYFVSLVVFESGWFPVYGLKRWLLRLFGARIGHSLYIKPHVRIKYPWRFTAGDYCSLGEEVWIDNLENVRLGNHVCISQRTYLCTGSHDYRSRGFDLLLRPIQVSDGAWIAAACLVLGGVSIGANAVVAAGSVVVKDVPPATVVGGNPVHPLRTRTMYENQAE